MNAKHYIKVAYYLSRTFAYIKHVHFYHKQVKYGIDKEKRPFLQFNNKVFHSFYPTERELQSFDLLNRFYPKSFQKSHYRVMRDFLTRYIYPHMMPTLKPHYPTYLLSGFHGQHKDAIDDIKGKYLRDELKVVFSIKEDDIIINGGSYLGFGDLRVSEINTLGKIFAVEAENKCFEILRLNLNTNGVKNVHPLNNALWNKSEKRSLLTTDTQANSLIDQIVKEANKQIIDCITVDKIVETYSPKKVDFVSLTLNGAEVETLDGMKETLSLYKPRIRLAGWYFRGNDPIWKISSEKLKLFNYKVVVGKRGSVYAYHK